MNNTPQKIATELGVRIQQVEATIKLLNDGATVPFIARYRKEVTGSLSDTQLRDLQERLTYLTELEERRSTILDSIEKQGKLAPELKAAILETDNKARLEDLYLPYKPKRRTKAQIAKEAGLEPLADELVNDPCLNPPEAANHYINLEKEIKDAAAALEGARHILMERFAENADLINMLREYTWDNGILKSTVMKDKETEGAKFSDYFNYQEPLKKAPSHRALAVFRGQKEDILSVSIGFSLETDEETCIRKIATFFNIQHKSRAADAWLAQTIEWTWKIKLKLKIDVDLLMRLREKSEEEAINVFKENLKNLLMAAPAGHLVTMGLDPGLRTGVKLVVVDDTGKLLEYATIFPHVPRNAWDESIETIITFCKKHQVHLISIGNGTASRETDRLVMEVIKRAPELKITKMVVSEAGASVYSASALAANEFPNLDVTYRGAVSIARRLQDPLAELVKIDPKSIGVGQYQHDLNQIKLGQSLEAVLEDCVNAVGADVNTASVPLLKSIAGLNETTAQNIVAYRETHGRFSNRELLKKVPRMGDKTYEQAIGFLRVIGGDNPLDASAVHPEAYPLIEKILHAIKKPIQEIMGNIALISSIPATEFADEKFGLPTIKDILIELQKPGRDPRPEFKTAKFSNVENLSDLKVDMQLEGVVTNVTNFGAFIDIGVHQDGLVHISQLANHYISDPNQVVKVGQIVQVKVLEVDIPRKRIQLTMKTSQNRSNADKPARSERIPKLTPPREERKTFFGDALLTAFKK